MPDQVADVKISPMGSAPDLPLHPKHLFTPLLCHQCGNEDRVEHPLVGGLCSRCDPARAPNAGA
jgi:hypothetical protein